ncbi:MAG: hypothetical protein LBQ76_08620 [Candidatus Fibromonas sp.]|jgi:hypothetical protein|nr:hypothetical protein [Candidatus Fibromonas sp.]
MMSLAELLETDKELEAMRMEELNEMQLSGDRLYWHGSFSPKLDLSENIKKIGEYSCFFFTTHFGYALSYICRVGVGELSFYKQFPKMQNEIDATGVKFSGTNEHTGYMFPLKLKLGANIYDSHRMGDVHYLFTLIGRDERMNGVFLKHKIDKMDFADKMATTDWFNVEKESSNVYLHGIKRDDILELLHKNTEGVVFHGFSNYEYEKFHSIGMFKDKVPEYLKQANPLKVSFRKNINKKKIVNGKIEIMKDVIRIGYDEK